MAVPPGLSVDLTAYLQGIEDRLGKVETPKGFVPAFLTTSDKLNTLNAAQSGAKWAVLTDLKTAAYSDGANWRRIDTGATIV